MPTSTDPLLRTVALPSGDDLRRAPDASLKRLVEHLRAHPTDHDARFHLAEALARMERHTEAQQAHRELLRLDGRYAELLEPAGGPAVSGFIGGFDEADCPVCGDPGGEPVWVGNISVQHRLHGHLDPVRTWVQCGGCETIRVSAPPTDAALARWEAHRDTTVATPPKRADLTAQVGSWDPDLDAIERAGFGNDWTFDPGAAAPRLLEVGSRWGSFLLAARWRGFSASGVSLPAEVAWSREHLGVHCHTASGPRDITKDTLPDAIFDVIVCRWSLDRTADPVDTLETLASHLAPDGLLALQLALHDHPHQQLRGFDDPRWTTPSRRVFFTRPSLEVALSRAGLQLDSVRHPTGAPAGTSLVLARLDDIRDVLMPG